MNSVLAGATNEQLGLTVALGEAVAVAVDDAAADDCRLGAVTGDAVSSDDADGIDDVDGADDVPGIAAAWIGAGAGDGHTAVGKTSFSWPAGPAQPGLLRVQQGSHLSGQNPR